MLLTRKQVDDLVRAYPAYMKTKWLKLRRKWCLGGVRVTGTHEQMEQLRFLLKPEVMNVSFSLQGEV
jgi:hypothetical protein